MRHDSSYSTPHPARRTPLGLIVAGIVLASLPIIGFMVWLALQWRELSITAPGFTSFIRYTIVLMLVVFPGWALGVTIIAGWRRFADHKYIQAHHVTQLTRAQTQVAPLATSFSWSDAHQIGSTQPAMLALPESSEPLDVIKPMLEWMNWIDEQPHALLGGKTKAGKTWLATALLERRIDNGSDIFILDPHSSDWMGLPTAGGSGIPERRDALKAVLNEYLHRMAVREAHKRQTGRELPHDYFDPLVVLIDEANAMLEELAAEWKTVLKQVASGSRKVSISLLMLAQSPLVEDLGISGAMRENFSRIALDDRTVQALIDSERDKPRKAALQQAFRTMDRPAAAQIGSTVWLLDRRGMSPGQASAGARIWAGWDFANGRAVSKVSPQNGVISSSSNPPYVDDDVSETVISPGAVVSTVISVSLSVAEVANIATLLLSSSPSEAAKKIDGYNGRNYREMKEKVDAVKALIEGVK